ncbi:MAG TPA: hypothetical protein VFZ48_04250 [Candidatus Saccharimonadales bacterium]
MQSIKKPRRKLPIIIALAIGLLLIGGGTLAYYLQHKNTQQVTSQQSNPKENDVDYNPPSNEQVNNGSGIKEGNLPSKNPDQHVTPQQPTDGTKREVVVEISSVTQTASVLKVRVAAETIDGGSTCKATLTKGPTTGYSGTVKTQTMPSYSLCKGFDIPLKDIAKGEWKFDITFESTNFKGTASQSIIIE